MRTLYRNGRIYSPADPFATAMLVDCVSIAWLGSDDAKDVHGEVFRVGMGTVWLMKGWHTAARVAQTGTLKFWDPAELGAQVKEQLAKGLTKKEGLAEVLTGKV